MTRQRVSTGSNGDLRRAAGKDEILDRQGARESNARTYARWLNIVPIKAQGAVITAHDGRTYLDCLAGAGTLALGHNHPEVSDALQAVLQSGAPLHTLDVATPTKDLFVTELFASLPEAFLAKDPRVQFCSPSGADAVEASIKLCQTATGRSGIAAFAGAYHGMTLGTLAISGAVATRTPIAGLGTQVSHFPYPYPARCPFGVGDATGRLSANYVRQALADPAGGVLRPALMIVEPVQGEGGVIPSPVTWLAEIAAICQESGTPLVVDEVQTGVGRTGMMWAHEHSDVVPDVIVASKAIGGGLPLAVILYQGHLDQWQPGSHAGTFRGNALAMAAGAATLMVVRRDDLACRADHIGTGLTVALGRELAAARTVKEIRGRGLMIGIEMVQPVESHGASLAIQVRSACLDRGVITEVGGRDDSVVRLLPPLTITDAQVEAVLQTICEAVYEVEAAQ